MNVTFFIGGTHHGKFYVFDDFLDFGDMLLVTHWVYPFIIIVSGFCLTYGCLLIIQFRQASAVYNNFYEQVIDIVLKRFIFISLL